MLKNENSKKSVCVAISMQDHERLVRLAKETGRTKSGYLRWLLHEHFRQQDVQNKKYK